MFPGRNPPKMVRESTLKTQNLMTHQVAVIKDTALNTSLKDTGLRRKQTSPASLPLSTSLLPPVSASFFPWQSKAQLRFLTTDQAQA